MSGVEGTRREFILQLAAFSHSNKLLNEPPLVANSHFENACLDGYFEGSAEGLWRYRIKSSGWEYRIAPPVFNLDGERIEALLSTITQIGEPEQLPNGGKEYRYRGIFARHSDLSLTMLFRVGVRSPIVRFRYVLESAGQHKLTKSHGNDDLTYLAISLDSLPRLTEVRVANFMELFHSYCLEEVLIEPPDDQNRLEAMGPIVVASDQHHSLLVAYEHGSQVPDAFLRFEVDSKRTVSLRATKANYLSGESRRYETIWLETGAVDGSENQLASAFRSFVMSDMSPSLASRKPYISYNTWNFQERNRWVNHRSYVDSMNDARILSEIDVAHRMGIEVFVLDAGWFQDTGSWHVSSARFPGGLKKIKARLDQYDMKLGVWLGVPYAAPDSEVYQQNKDCVMAWQGKDREPSTSWESAGSYSMCLVSRFGDAFAEQMIRLARENGVTCFKWDAVEQYACDSPHHWHGNSSHSEDERAHSHVFQLPLQMNRIVERLLSACPEAIVDFDVTERHRAFGLSFLAAGRYSLLNNGPYYHSLDIPDHRENSNWNVYFFKGPARTWVCRAPLKLDRWIPSNLLLTHYYPDDPISSQEVNLASLVLGQNGIWGDLLGVSNDGVDYIASVISRYKRVREDVAASDPIMVGEVSGSPEIHEKISVHSGKGVVSIFSSTAGVFTYVTQRRVTSPYWVSHGAEVTLDASRRARITASFDTSGAKILFFGTD